MKAKAKGHIYENEEARIRYEDLYSKNWCVQNRLDVSERPNLRGQIKIKTFSEKSDEIKNLSKNAKMVNSFLSRNMKIPTIGEVMFSTETLVRNIRKKLKTSIENVKASGDKNKLNTLKQQLDKLNKIGGVDAIVPSEGIVFKYKGKTYKFTGAFAPINQITGLIYF